MKKLFTLFTMLLMMVTASFAAAPDGIGNITVEYHPANSVLDIIFEDQEDVVPSWSVDIKLDGEKVNCEMGQEWNEIYGYPNELAVGKHTIVFPAGSLMLNSTTIYDKECSATFVVADFTATVSQLPTNDYSTVNAEFKLSEIAKAFSTDAATLESALQAGSATFGLFDADGQLIGTTSDGPGSYWMKADGSVTNWGQDAVAYNGLINYNASADILVIPVGQYPDAFKGGEIWVNVFTLKYNGTSKTLGVMLKIIGEPQELGPQLKSTLAITDSKWATFVAPYEVTLPEGVTAYTVKGKDDNNATLILKGVEGKLSANTPVVVYSEKPVEKEYYQPIVEGIPQEGIMVGVLVNTDIRSGYVLQNQNGLVGFYQVNGIKTVPANRAYIAQSASTEGIDDERVKGYFFDTTTALKALDAMTAGKAEIYDMNGRKQTRLQKGVNIVNGVKVLVK